MNKLNQEGIIAALSTIPCHTVELKNLSELPLMSQVKKYNENFEMPPPVFVEGFKQSLKFI